VEILCSQSVVHSDLIIKLATFCHNRNDV